jgi:hypothetical protein
VIAASGVTFGTRAFVTFVVLKLLLILDDVGLLVDGFLGPDFDVVVALGVVSLVSSKMRDYPVIIFVGHLSYIK